MDTGVLRTGPRRAGIPATHIFFHLFLSPFNDNQVSQYLKKRYGFFQKRLRAKGRAIVELAPDLMARPMLLAHIDDIIHLNLDDELTLWTVYDTMVKAWLDRERGFVGDPDAMRSFSEKLAVDIYKTADIRGAERIPKSELSSIAAMRKVVIEDWKLTGRSLLNRDTSGRFKFSHRSIMEFLVVRAGLNLEPDAFGRAWTYQMGVFFWNVALLGPINRKDLVEFFSVQGRNENIANRLLDALAQLIFSGASLSIGMEMHKPIGRVRDSNMTMLLKLLLCAFSASNTRAVYISLVVFDSDSHRSFGGEITNDLSDEVEGEIEEIIDCPCSFMDKERRANLISEMSAYDVFNRVVSIGMRSEIIYRGNYGTQCVFVKLVYPKRLKFGPKRRRKKKANNRVIEVIPQLRPIVERGQPQELPAPLLRRVQTTRLIRLPHSPRSVPPRETESLAVPPILPVLVPFTPDITLGRVLNGFVARTSNGGPADGTPQSLTEWFVE